MKKWSFKVIKGPNERPQIKVNFKGEERPKKDDEESVYVMCLTSQHDSTTHVIKLQKVYILVKEVKMIDFIDFVPILQ